MSAGAVSTWLGIAAVLIGVGLAWSEVLAGGERISKLEELTTIIAERVAQRDADDSIAAAEERGRIKGCLAAGRSPEECRHGHPIRVPAVSAAPPE